MELCLCSNCIVLVLKNTTTYSQDTIKNNKKTKTAQQKYSYVHVVLCFFVVPKKTRKQ